jgi:acyl-CoA reductase-like NAD-dependent aldehyde dehydrogenase
MDQQSMTSPLAVFPNSDGSRVERATSVADRRASALSAAGVANGFSNLIGGKPSISVKSLEVLDPATGEVLATVPDIDRHGVDRAFGAARRAFPAWSTRSWDDRRSIILTAIEKLREHRSEIVTLLMAEGGRPSSLAEWEAASVLDDFGPGVLAQSLPDVVFKQAGVGVVTKHYPPLGVVAAISPWNLPFLLSFDKVVPALLTGNTVVLKPSPFTPLTVLRAAELIRDILPAGTLNVVTGGDDVGPWMTSHPEADKVSFTGSTQTGRRVFSSAAETLKHLTLELGGNDAGIVLPDVDVAAAVGPIFWGMFLVNGQGCITIKRLIVHESRYDELATALVKFTAQQKLGDGFDPETAIGPVQNRPQLGRLNATWEAIKRDGTAVLYRGEEIAGPGNFFPVTILDNPPIDAEYVLHENFGPLRSMIKYSTIDEAISIANSTDYGLGGSVWGQDPELLNSVARRVEAGTTWINQHLVLSPNVPFGGNKDSGLGLQYALEGLKEYCYQRVISSKQ